MRNLNLLFAFLITLNSFSQNAEVRFLKSCNKPNMPIWDKTMEGVSFSVYPAMPLTVGGICAVHVHEVGLLSADDQQRSPACPGTPHHLTLPVPMAVRRGRPAPPHRPASHPLRARRVLRTMKAPAALGCPGPCWWAIRGSNT